MNTYLRLLLLHVCLAMPLFSDAEEAYFKDFITYLELTGTNDVQRSMLKQMFHQFKKSSSDPSSLQKIEDQMEKELNDLNKKLFPVYKKHISHEDLKLFIEFYKTPAAKRVIQAQPQIVQESMAIGMAWGQDVAKRMMNP